MSFQRVKYPDKHKWRIFEISLETRNALVEFVYWHEPHHKKEMWRGWATRAWDLVSGVILPRIQTLQVCLCALWVQATYILLVLGISQRSPSAVIHTPLVSVSYPSSFQISQSQYMHTSTSNLEYFVVKWSVPWQSLRCCVFRSFQASYTQEGPFPLFRQELWFTEFTSFTIKKQDVPFLCHCQRSALSTRSFLQMWCMTVVS